ncbi:MAG TPA: hypothetical protein PLU50_05365 [Pseudobdellovibrionaceae bacterium]|nr:hypothetical protein [Pseudobdellovibrionaceae bacterium]
MSSLTKISCAAHSLNNSMPVQISSNFKFGKSWPFPFFGKGLDSQSDPRWHRFTLKFECRGKPELTTGMILNLAKVNQWHHEWESFPRLKSAHEELERFGAMMDRHCKKESVGLHAVELDDGVFFRRLVMGESGFQIWKGQRIQHSGLRLYEIELAEPAEQSLAGELFSQIKQYLLTETVSGAFNKIQNLHGTYQLKITDLSQKNELPFVWEFTKH